MIDCGGFLLLLNKMIHAVQIEHTFTASSVTVLCKDSLATAIACKQEQAQEYTYNNHTIHIPLCLGLLQIVYHHATDRNTK